MPGNRKSGFRGLSTGIVALVYGKDESMKRTSLLMTGITRKSAWLLFAAAILAVTPAMVLAQDKYPIQVVPVGKGPYNFPKGFRTDFSKVDIIVTEKLSPNLYVLHGNAGVDSAHPDASGGRMTVLFGDDGVLLVDRMIQCVVGRKTAYASV